MPVLNSDISCALCALTLAGSTFNFASLKEKLQAKNERLDERTDNIIRKANEQAAAILKEAKDFADETIKAFHS